MNSTTPTPSLNSDSPAICTSSAFGAPICLSRPSTAIGSVGEISAPKSRQSMNRKREAQQCEDAPHQHGHDHGREHHAHRGEDQDRPLLPGEVAQVDVEAPGEEEKAEHAVEQDAVEVEMADDRAGLLGERGNEPTEREQAQGKDQRQGHQPDRRGQPEESNIEEAEPRGQHGQDRQQVKQTHQPASPSRLPPWLEPAARPPGLDHDIQLTHRVRVSLTPAADRPPEHGQGRSNRNQESAASTTGGDHECAGGRVGGGIPLDPTQADGDRSSLRRARRLRPGVPQRGARERRPVHRHLQRAERRLCRRRLRSPQGCGGVRDDLRRGRAERAQRPGRARSPSGCRWSRSPGLRRRLTSTPAPCCTTPWAITGSRFKIYSRVTAASAILETAESAPAEIDRVLTACLVHQQPVYLALPADVVRMRCPAPGPFQPPSEPASDAETLQRGARGSLGHARMPPSSRWSSATWS